MDFNFDLSYNFKGSSNNKSSMLAAGGLGLTNHPTSSFNPMFDGVGVKQEDLFFSDEEENEPRPRLPLFGRCPLTNRAYLDTSFTSSPGRPRPAQHSQENDTEGVTSKPRLNTNRVPLLQISNQLCNVDLSKAGSPVKSGLGGQQVSWSQIARKPGPATTPDSFAALLARPLGVNYEDVPKPGSVSPTGQGKKPGLAGSSKPSLDEVKDDSLVAMTNKHGKGKYWFKSGCPTPDPRWSARQQLMIGPIPGDVEYATLRSAFLSKGHTIHLFIQNNQAWLEKNQEKFGKKQVKFGYVVYTEPEVARRLLAAGHVLVGHAKVAVKEMDGQPALFTN